jgi:hypothetical protein
MTAPKFNLPGEQEKKMAENRFVGTKVTKKTKFMGQDLDICKLTITQVMRIQAQAKVLEENASETENLKLLSIVVQEGAKELSELTAEQLYEFPMDELTTLSNEIMKYSGLGNKEAK